MNTTIGKKQIKKSISILTIFMLCLSSFFVGFNGLTLTANEPEQAVVTQPELPQATEVEYSAQTTAEVASADEYLAAYRNPKITRILLTNDIDLAVHRDILNGNGRDGYKLSRSLLVDGQGWSLQHITNWGVHNDNTAFRLDDLKGQKATIHLRNLNVWSKGLNFIDAGGGGTGARNSEGWQIILDDVEFLNKGTDRQPERVRRVGRFSRAHVFFRNKVTMKTSSESFYVGQVTVEPRAEVFAQVMQFGDAVWWFENSAVTTSAANGSVQVGENAKLELKTESSTGYPVMYGHWTRVDVHRGATLTGTKQNLIFGYYHTPNVPEKHIHVHEGATFTANSTGGRDSVLETKSGAVKGHFYAGKDANVSFIGETNNDNKAIVSMSSRGSSFELDRVGSYEIRNNRKTAKAIDIGTDGNLTFVDTDIAVWKKDSQQNLDGDPNYSWTAETAVIDSKGRVNSSTSSALQTIWNTVEYARISGVGEAAHTDPELPVATEVNYSAATTATVGTAEEYVAAYANPQISRIVLTNDIDVSAYRDILNGSGARGHKLTRSLQVDGGGHTLKHVTNWGAYNDYGLFTINDLKGAKATLHLKNMNFWTKGLNVINAGGGGTGARNSEGWEFILDDVEFLDKGTERQPERARRIGRLSRGHVFFRNKVTMASSGENFYIGQGTVEKNANVYGSVNYFGDAIWWFENANVLKSATNGSVNVGEGAKLELVGLKGRTYPTFYQHWTEINIHRGATFNARKEGNVLAYHHTNGITDKRINVYPGANVTAVSTAGHDAVLETKNGNVRGHFYASPGSALQFVGTRPGGRGIVSMNSRGSTFEIDSVASYDFRNLYPTGKVFDVGNEGQIKIISSDISVWKKDSKVNLGGPPTASWKDATIVSENNGRASSGSHADLTKIWNANDYARIAG